MQKPYGNAPHLPKLEREAHKGCLCGREQRWRGEGLWGELPPEVPSLPDMPFQLLLNLLSFQRVHSGAVKPCTLLLLLIN